jgi:TPR repeat protein
MFKRIVIGIPLALAVSLHATAQDFEKGLAAFEREDYAAAQGEWCPLAADGDAVAQYNLGIVALYSKGRGNPRSYSEAVQWWLKAAKQGHRQAQYNLGWMYDRGHGVAQDDVLAHFWYGRSAAKGDKAGYIARTIVAKRMLSGQLAKAQAMARGWPANRDEYGVQYAARPGGPQDTAAPVKCDREAAKRGPDHAKLDPATLNPTGMSGTGEGVPQAHIEAVLMAHRTAKPGNAGAPNRAPIMADRSPAVTAPRPPAPMDPHAQLRAAKREPVTVKPLPAPAGTDPRVQLRALKSKAVAVTAPPAPARRYPRVQLSALNPKSLPVKVPPASVPGTFRVQLSALKSKTLAVEKAAFLSRIHKPILGELSISLVRVNLGARGVFYRLHAGPLSDHAAANSLCRKLMARKQSCFVVKL